MKRNVWAALVFVCVLGLVAQAEVIRDTSYGNGADTYVGNDSQIGPDTNVGSENRMRWRQAADSRSKVPYIRLDISEVAGDLSGGYLSFETTYMKSGGKTVTVFGLTDESLDLWDESTITYNNAPGMLAATTGNYDLDEAKFVELGTFVSSSEDAPVILTSDPVELDMTGFLQSDTNGVITLVLIGGSDETEVATKEHASYMFPTLTLPNAVVGGPANPDPADGSTITNLNLSEVCWENYNVGFANVYFGSAADANESNFQEKLPLIDTITEPGQGTTTCASIPAGELPLAVPATYYWAVETFTYQADDPNHVGEPNLPLSNGFFSFMTSAIPVAQTVPADQYKFPTEPATFSVQFESLTPVIAATWYNDGAPVGIAPTVTPDGGNLYTVTLDITSVALADDGLYTCIAENSGGLSDPSNGAYLVVKRRLAKWEFEDDLTDEEGTYDGTMLDDPNLPTFDTGYTGAGSSLGQALVLDGSTDAVVLPAGFENFRAGMTIAVWANPSAVAAWARFFDTGTGPGADNIFLTREGDTDNLIYNNNDGAVNAADAIALNEWQFFVVTVTETGDVKMFKNGLEIQTGTVGIPAVVTRDLNYIGDSNYEGDSFYAGMIDELSVYNYALTDDEAALLYAAVEGDYCRYPLEHDFDNSCLIDLGDIAVLAAEWLDCGLYPNCP